MTAEQDDFLESMAEADEAVINHMHGKMMYLNVMNRLSVDCDCLPNPSEPDMHDIGVLSSLDPVALDQACVDLIHIAPDGASGKTTLSRNLNERFGGNVLHMDDFFLRSVRLPGLAKVLVAQLAGRVVLIVATAIAVFAFGSTNAIAATWTSDLAAGLPGLALQWALIPLAAYWTESLIAKRGR